MIAPMDQLLIVGRKRGAQDVLTALQSLGVMQIDPLEPAEGLALARLKLAGADKQAKEDWNAAVAKSEALLDALVAEDVTPAPKSEVPTQLADIKSYLGDVDAQVDELLAERVEGRDELELISTYLPVFRELAPSLAQLESSHYLYGSAFVVPADRFAAVETDLNEALDEDIVLSTKPYAKQTLVVAGVLRSMKADFLAALGRLGLAELQLPDRYADLGVAKAVHVMEERSQTLPKRQRVIDDELAQLREQHGAKLQALQRITDNHHRRYEALEDMAEGRYSFALSGWVPSAERAKVTEGLKKQFGEDIVIEFRLADEHVDHNVPVKFDNPAWVRPFEGLLALFAPPKYGSFDPSWTLAVFFPLYFGLVIGDIGFGLLFLALGFWLRARGKAGKSLDLGPIGITIGPGALPVVGTVINWCAVWGIVWGFLYGEFFGNLLERWPQNNPIFYPTGEGHHGLIPILLFRVEEYTPLLLLSLGFGVLQVLGGWLIRVIYATKHGDKKHFWEGIGMFAGLTAIVIFATAFLLNALSTPIWLLVGLGLVVFLVGMVLSGVYLMIIELPSNSGNILSFLRLFAVGLSAALVANLITDLGFAMSGFAPVIGPLVGIIVAAAVHLLALGLTIIGHALQPLRLQYVEFFTKFGFYDENGRPYKPFRLLGGKA